MKGSMWQRLSPIQCILSRCICCIKIVHYINSSYFAHGYDSGSILIFFSKYSDICLRLVVNIIVLKFGPARRVDPGPGRLGPETGSGLSKNPPGSWPGETRSTRNRVTRANPAETRPLFLYIYIAVKRHRIGILKGQNDEDEQKENLITDRDEHTELLVIRLYPKHSVPSVNGLSCWLAS